VLLEKASPDLMPGEVHQALIGLEMKQVIVQLPSARYLRK
jgi:hypothetical protein